MRGGGEQKEGMRYQFVIGRIECSFGLFFSRLSIWRGFAGTLLFALLLRWLLLRLLALFGVDRRLHVLVLLFL